MYRIISLAQHRFDDESLRATMSARVEQTDEF